MLVVIMKMSFTCLSASKWHWKPNSVSKKQCVQCIPKDWCICIFNYSTYKLGFFFSAFFSKYHVKCCNINDMYVFQNKYFFDYNIFCCSISAFRFTWNIVKTHIIKNSGFFCHCSLLLCYSRLLMAMLNYLICVLSCEDYQQQKNHCKVSLLLLSQ